MTARAHEQLTAPSVGGAKGDVLLASKGVEVLVRVELHAGRGGRKGGKEGDEGGEGEHLGGGKGGGVGWRGRGRGMSARKLNRGRGRRGKECARCVREEECVKESVEWSERWQDRGE